MNCNKMFKLRFIPVVAVFVFAITCVCLTTAFAGEVNGELNDGAEPSQYVVSNPSGLVHNEFSGMFLNLWSGTGPTAKSSTASGATLKDAYTKLKEYKEESAAWTADSTNVKIENFNTSITGVNFITSTICGMSSAQPYGQSYFTDIVNYKLRSFTLQANDDRFKLAEECEDAIPTIYPVYMSTPPSFGKYSVPSANDYLGSEPSTDPEYLITINFESKIGDITSADESKGTISLTGTKSDFVYGDTTSLSVDSSGNLAVTESAYRETITSAATTKQWGYNAVPANGGNQLLYWELTDLTDASKTVKVAKGESLEKLPFPCSIKAYFGVAYDITYNLNDGQWKDGYSAPTTYTEGDTVTLPTADNITKDNYTFEGWYLDEQFSGSPVTEISSTDTGDKAFYAKWAEVPVPPVDPPVTPTDNTESSVGSDQAATSDNAPLIALSVLGCVSVCGLVLAKKKQ